MSEFKIKFWDKDKKKISRKYLINGWGDIYRLNSFGQLEYMGDQIEVIRYTGKEDKNGNDIYEGDVIGGYPHGTVYIQWNDEYACFDSISVDDGTNEGLFANDLKDCKDEWGILGNIYENPELMRRE